VRITLIKSVSRKKCQSGKQNSNAIEGLKIPKTTFCQKLENDAIYKTHF
jgi:hypothetical protein